jgi:hypothetical protein
VGSKRTRNVLLLVAIALYLVACVMPALCVEQYRDVTSVPGWFTLMLGWIPMFGLQFAWLANLLGLGALIASDRRFGTMPPILLALGAVLVAQQTWMLIGTRTALDDEGHEYLFTAPGIGFYLWVLSFILIGVASRFGPPEDPL